MRLIDADALKVLFCEENEDIPNGYNDDLDDYFGSGFSAGRVSTLIDSAKTVDAVPVVRCKDCKYAHMTDDGYTKYCDFWSDAYDEYSQLYLEPGSYCSCGERKEETENAVD